MTEEPASTAVEDNDYSRAFEKLVGGADDIVGLLAYAKYKQSVREAAQAGVKTEKNTRSIPPSLVGALRSAAEQMLTEVINSGIAQATPDIQSTAVVATLDAHHAELLGVLREERQRVEQHVDKRTNFWPAFGTNFLAWIVGLIITVAILYISGRPSAESMLSERLGSAPRTANQKQ